MQCIWHHLPFDWRLDGPYGHDVVNLANINPVFSSMNRAIRACSTLSLLKTYKMTWYELCRGGGGNTSILRDLPLMHAHLTYSLLRSSHSFCSSKCSFCSSKCSFWYSQSVIIYVPMPQLKNFQKIQIRLVRELEKKFSGKHVVFVGDRKILPKPTRKTRTMSKQKRPRRLVVKWKLYLTTRLINHS